MNIENSILIRNLTILISVLLILIIYYLIHIGNKHVENKKKVIINKNRFLPILIIIFIYTLYLLSNKYTILSDTFYTIIISAVLAYLFNPIINYFEKYKISRSLGILILYIVILGSITLISFSIIPRIIKEIRELLIVSPNYFKKISNFFNDLYVEYYKNMGNISSIFQSVEQVVLDNISRLQNVITTNISRFFEGIIQLFSKVVSLILIPILTFYFLRDKEHFKNKLYLTVPKKRRKEVKELALEIDRALSQFIRGRLILAIYVGIATTIFLLILGIDFAIVIGLITGIADIIPYFGPFLAFVPAVIFAFLNNPIKALWVGIMFIGIQWIENNVLAPKVIGDSTGIHPITVLLSLIIGGGIFGVMGMIFSVPVIAIFKIIFSFFMDKIRKRNIID